MLTRRTDPAADRPGSLQGAGNAHLGDRASIDARRIEIVALGGYLDVEARPFERAVAAYPALPGAGRALAIWERFVIGLLDVTSQSWSADLGCDLYDGDTRLFVESEPPYVEIVSDAPLSKPDPMQLRGVIHLAESMRPSMRREAAVSTSELDSVIGTVVADAIVRFPVDACVDPERAARSLQRIGGRYESRRGHASSLSMR
ncbi:MAG: hypothetical protein AAGA42_04975 [Actinomycetota bacterium]